MAKIFNLYEGDSWENSAGKTISIVKVLGDGHIMITSPDYNKSYKVDTRSTIYNINNGTYKNFHSKIPAIFVVHANQSNQKGKTLYTLCRSLLHKYYEAGLISQVPPLICGTYLYYNRDEKKLEQLSGGKADKLIQAGTPVLDYERFVSIYNSFSINLKKYNDVNREKRQQDQEIREQREKSINPCQEIFLDEKGVNNSKSNREDGRQVRLSSKVGKIGIEKSQTGGKIRFKRSEGRFKVPTIQWRIQHREICRA